jgi:hypothetical protein
MNLVVNNLSIATGNWIGACCSNDMNKIALVSSTVGTKGIWISTNKGATWTQTTSATIPAQTSTDAWRPITCSNDFTRIIAAREGGGIYYSSDSGVSWVKTAAPDPRDYWSIAGSTSLNTIYAVTNSTTSGGIFKTTGFTATPSTATWTPVVTNDRNYSFVCCSSDATKVAVTLLTSADNSSNWGILISTDSGSTWTGKNLLNSSSQPQFFRSICCTPNFTKLAAVTNSANSTTKLWISTNSGVTWTNREANIYTGNNMDNVAISCSNDFSYIVICNYATLSGSGVLSGVYYSVDSGTTFRMAQIPGINWHATCFSKTTDEFVVVKNGTGTDGIYRGTFVDGTTTIKNTNIDINLFTSNFSTYGQPLIQIGLSNSIHMPVNCYTNASNAHMKLVLDEYALLINTGVSFWPTFDPFNQSDTLYFYWKYNNNSNVTTRYFASIGFSMNLFTGQHKTLPDDPTIKQNLLQNVGLIMSSNDTGYTSCDSENNVYSGKRAIYINEALPNCSLSVIDEDPCVFGIITNNTNGNSGKYDDTTTEFCTSLNDSVRVNSLGEGAIWVSNINGPIQNGDWITTSRIPGVGKKQNEIRRCNYTVAKATMSCDFDLGSDKYKSKPVEFEGQTYIMAFIGVTYHCG